VGRPGEPLERGRPLWEKQGLSGEKRRVISAKPCSGRREFLQTAQEKRAAARLRESLITKREKTRGHDPTVGESPRTGKGAV